MAARTKLGTANESRLREFVPQLGMLGMLARRGSSAVERSLLRCTNSQHRDRGIPQLGQGTHDHAISFVDLPN